MFSPAIKVIPQRVAHKIDGAVIATLRDYLAKIKSTPKDIALEKRYKSEISEYRRKQTKLGKEIEKLKKTGG